MVVGEREEKDDIVAKAAHVLVYKRYTAGECWWTSVENAFNLHSNVETRRCGKNTHRNEENRDDKNEAP